ncbi:MAG: ferric reductase-like transmembrane domain-containing protein [Acidobacteriota bacterium]|nr:ferric reductase-like transmembrane domain-containing protein [Acidobacteriota bacterium]
MSGSSFKRRRLARRLLIHHLPLAAASFLSGYLLYITRPYPDVITRLSFSTAYPALALLAATLVIGPWNLWTSRPNPISSDFRRDIGIWAGITGIAHAGIGQCVHLRGRPWLYYVYGPWEHGHVIPVRHDLFGFSNYTGVLSVLFLAALFATSNDWSLRKLGTPQWKGLQRWNYLVFAAAGAHAIGYLFIEKQKFNFDLTIAIFLAIAIAFQGAGFLLRRRRQTITA